VSQLPLRRYRAERLLREEFDALRVRVLSSVRTRLRGNGATFTAADLDAAYSLAWQGLYAAVLDGQEVGNPAGWLAVAAYRRAIDEQRVQARRSHGGTSLDLLGEVGTDRGPELPAGGERDLAAELDDRVRLRQLFEGLRGRLSGRELQAATLCYLQGLTRAEAALLMGISAERMRKVMEGEGPRRPGVAGKVGALVGTISSGGWCEEQGSLMRALAFGVLDPAGERYRLAQLHRSECPACRAYVLSLRGLASVLPPLPSLLHVALGSGTAATAGASAIGGASLGAGPAIAGTLSASGAGGAAGGGWLLAGGSAKLAMGCLLALTVGAGCVALSGGLPHGHPPDGRPAHARGLHRAGPASAGAAPSGSLAGAASSATQPSSTSSALTPVTRATREFGPEQGLLAGAARSVSVAGGRSANATAAASAFERAEPRHLERPGGCLEREQFRSRGT
jgi:DNA-directed RNA polymerase specialized sigma24 family protein